MEESFEKKKMYEAEMTKEYVKEILNIIDDNKFFIKVKFVRDNSFYNRRDNYAFKIINKYQSIWEPKRAGKKFISGGPNIVLIKKTKSGFWVEIDEKFLIREIQIKLFNFENLMVNTVVYRLYRIWKPDSKWLMLIKDGVLNCMIQQVIEYFEKAKKGYRLISICKQKIGT